MYKKFVFDNIQIKNVKEYQKSPFFYHLNCVNKCGKLNVNQEGLICDKCGYTQKNILEYIINGEWRKFDGSMRNWLKKI